ncbi:MAG: hypothetical protein KGI57_12325 [Hyphomicrobiales bacterium]|nr:hypothetical protein [Hyphomicrobiales bacterium]MDE2018476.1 hypothetical protein [Hyphomicrobiales bacterium]
MLKKVLVAAAVGSMVLGSAFAATMDAKKPAMKPQSPAGIECSKEADAKGLHGAARKKFRAKCKHDAMGKMGGAMKPKKK